MKQCKGISAQSVALLPREVLRGRGDTVLVVDEQNRLRIRAVEILRTTREQVVVRSGLAAGERVIVSSVDAVVEGMPVRVVDGGRSAAEPQP